MIDCSPLSVQFRKVRLYLLRAKGLAAMDESWGGRPGKSDPYVRCSVGKSKYNGRKWHIEDSVDPDFYVSRIPR